MDCQQFQEILQDLARYEGLDAAVLRQALEHAEVCKLCDDLLEEADALSADLRALAEQGASRHAPASMETALLAAFAEHRDTARQRTRRRLAAVVGALGIAAMALFAIFLTRHATAAPATASSHLSPAAIAAANGSVANSSQLAEALPADQRDALSVFEDEDGTTASFVPLTETFSASSLDGDAVLRVALSRSDLANFGLSPSAVAQQRDQQVLADLIVSGDGIPQAIRLLPR